MALQLYTIRMSKLLVICGPTATGKTSLALKLAEKFGGEVLSADSRQLYRGMDIITGKDLPVKIKNQISNIKIRLVDLVDPTESFSVAQWRKEAQKVLHKVWKEKKPPILVGGTGFYIKSVVDGIETINVPPNKRLRAMLAGKSAEELYDMLGQLDSSRAASMNRSDRKNPRRLVRAIEVAQWKTEDRERKTDGEDGRQKMDALMVGLTAPRNVLYKRIDERVEKRLKEGALEEVKQLLRRGVSWDFQAMQGLGYRQLRDYFEKKASLQEAVGAWKTAEHQYARQQLTWFKRDKRIRWFDIDKEGWRSQVEKLVQSWYN